MDESLPLLNGFWAGFTDPADGAPTLAETPAYVEVVTLAFTGPADHDTYSTGYLCKYYPAETIIGWTRGLQQRGQKVLLSIYDNPDHHWANIDIPKFVANAVPIIKDEWGADGIDIDGESGNASAKDMIELVTEFRSALGPDAIITYDTFAFSAWDKEIIAAVADQVDWFNLMAYFVGYESMLQIFANYETLLPPEKITIGVKPGGKDPLDQSTPLPEVKQLAAWNPDGGCKRGMMLYQLARDIPFYTDKPPFTWTEAIHECMAPCLRKADNNGE